MQTVLGLIERKKKYIAFHWNGMRCRFSFGRNDKFISKLKYFVEEEHTKSFRAMTGLVRVYEIQTDYQTQDELWCASYAIATRKPLTNEFQYQWDSRNRNDFHKLFACNLYIAEIYIHTFMFEWNSTGLQYVTVIEKKTLLILHRNCYFQHQFARKRPNIRKCCCCINPLHPNGVLRMDKLSPCLQFFTWKAFWTEKLLLCIDVFFFKYICPVERYVITYPTEDYGHFWCKLQINWQSNRNSGKPPSEHKPQPKWWKSPCSTCKL